MNTEGSEACDALSNQIEYYESILGRKGLVERESDLRNYRLGLTLDLLKIVNMPEDLKSQLNTAIIDAWMLSASEMTLAQRKDELSSTLHSLETVRGAIKGTNKHPCLTGLLQLYIAVMFALPLIPSDLRSDDVQKVHDLLSKVMDHLAEKMDAASMQG